MDKEKVKTLAERYADMIAAAKTMTQAQVDACAEVMGGSGMGWTPGDIVSELEEDEKRFQTYFKNP